MAIYFILETGASKYLFFFSYVQGDLSSFSRIFVSFHYIPCYKFLLELKMTML